jgi:hypothetical protein
MQGFDERMMSGMTENKSAQDASHSQELGVMEGAPVMKACLHSDPQLSRSAEHESPKDYKAKMTKCSNTATTNKTKPPTK